VSEAKARFSDALREASTAPIVVHSRGRDIAALIGIDEYRKVSTRGTASTAARFLDHVDDLRRRLGGGVELQAGRAKVRPLDAWGSRPSRRRTGD
jgi:prevent-host-death family protein